MKKLPILILGARSDIGMAVAHKLASMGHPIQLAARGANSLLADKTNIELRYNVTVTLHEFDALALDTHDAFVAGLGELPQIAVCAVGLLGDQYQAEQDVQVASLIVRSNFEGPASILGVLANHFEKRGSGILVGISSVAGERGRATNYVYGSAKAGFTAFLSGLRNRLARKGIHVLTVLPGFVATRMTEGLDLPATLTTQPSRVAEAIAHACKRKKNVIYVGRVWWLITFVIRRIPEALFKRLRI
ncbi:MAG: SDR family oxidoreductase [Hyphomonadaceae bacterium]|nr:SDR family oxidoreductase [Hyphomonadaceae bacterium]